MRRLSLTLCALLFICAIPGISATIGAAPTATSIPPDIRAVFNKPRYKNAMWGLRVLDGDKVVVDLNSQRQLYIGSVRKVFSVGQLLNEIGANHRFDTPVYRTGSVDRAGVLHGNLIVVASGDLTMGGRTNPDGSIAVSNWDHNEADSLGNAVLTKPDPLAGYALLARAVRGAGIKRVSGNVVIDDRLFNPFFFRDQFYIRPIFVNDDVVDLTIDPRGSPGSLANVATRPVSQALTIVNRLRIGAPNAKDSLKIAPELPACIGNPGCSSTIAGTLPNAFTPPLTGTPALVQTVRIVQPSNYARTVFIEELRAAGVTVNAPAVQANPISLLPRQRAYSAGTKVAQLAGMRYGQDAKLILKISYNIGADTSLVLLGVRHGANSMDSALAYERRDLQQHWGIASSQYHFVDGSGGGETTATNLAVTTMLRELQKRPAAQDLVAALPALGVDGSLAFVKNFERDRTLAGATGNVHAKTGTYVAPGPSGAPVLNAQALGGYITSKRGHRLTFQLVVNNVPIKGIPDVTNVFQDEGTISAMLWRDY